MLRVAVLMDPIHMLDPAKDSTLALIRKGLQRDLEISIFHDDDVSIRDGAVLSRMKTATLNGDILKINNPRSEAIDSFDLLLMRRDPPFDMRFYTIANTLAKLEPDLKAINSPTGILAFPEKLWPATLKRLHPPTLITTDREEIISFKDEHKAIVLKPIYDYCGSGIYISSATDHNFFSVLDSHLARDDLPIIAQKYLTGVKKGDRRILMLGGEAVGAINRKAGPCEHRCNMFRGGSPTLYKLTKRETSICMTLGPLLIEHGLHFVGIDIIDDFVTEINTTAPAGLVQIRNLGGPDLSGPFWEYVEAWVK